ncbi:MAG: tetratricopeptide repeat protein [Bacteroidetes bacterium]|nr:tetratricopeptide repeat protein [Bacteroidota bacterium]
MTSKSRRSNAPQTEVADEIIPQKRNLGAVILIVSIAVVIAGISFGISRYVIEQSKPDKDQTFALANTNYDKGDFVTAAALYKRYLEKFDADNVSVKIDYGYALFKTNKQDEGIAVVKSVINADPQQAVAMYNLGGMYLEQGNSEEAVRWFKQCSTSQLYPGIAARAQDILSKISVNP